MKLKINGIRCQRTTIEIGKDEIYYVVFVNAVKRSEDGKPQLGDPAFWYVSTVEKFKKNHTWLCSNEHDISLPGDATDYIVQIGLFEQDNSAIRAEMMKLGNGPIAQSDFPWDEVGLPSSWTDPAKWVETILSWGKVLYKHFTQDDPLGVNMLHFMPGKPSNNGPGEFKYRKFRGKYALSFEITE